MMLVFPDFVAHVRRGNRPLHKLFISDLDRGHFYDLTEINWDLLHNKPLFRPEFIFAPSGVTIMEMVLGGTSEKHALFFVREDDAGKIMVHVLHHHHNDIPWSIGPIFRFKIREEGGYDYFRDEDWPPNLALDDEAVGRYVGTAVALLYSVNQPRTHVTKTWKLGDRQKVRGFRGAYFNGYTEVILKDRNVSEGPGCHTDIKKCLHYVRSHLRRYRNGQTVRVLEHWRGDPKLGIKDHRYRVKLPRKPPSSPPDIDPA